MNINQSNLCGQNLAATAFFAIRCLYRRSNLSEGRETTTDLWATNQENKQIKSNVAVNVSGAGSKLDDNRLPKMHGGEQQKPCKTSIF